jgi:small subunit ribosomal protein S9
MEKMTTKKKEIISIGKRKKAIARAYIKKGTGKIIINDRPLQLFNKYTRMRIEEALMLAGNVAKEVDITVNVKGGGIWGQTDAVRTAIANAILDFSHDNNIKQAYLAYDRSILVSDPRRTEPHKPSRSSAGPRRSKQQSKR